MTLLADLNLDKRLIKGLDQLGFAEATAVQARAIPHALAGRDLMIAAKTGSGKTGAFVLPMLNRLLAVDAKETGTRALILLPTRELAVQTERAFTRFAAFTHIKCGLVIGGAAFKYQIAAMRRNPEVIIATPGRLVEHIGKGSAYLSDLEMLVLDEADRMLDMGFSEDMNIIAGASGADRQSLLFSATLEHRAMDRIRGILKDPVSIVVDHHREGHSHITQSKVLADDAAHKERLVRALIKVEAATRSIVFCNTREQCQRLGTTLKRKDVSAAFIHGEIPQSERKQVMSRFRDGKVGVLVATDVAARGLDIADVDLVINFTVAQSGDDHVHRVGRTGRAGKEGKAITLVDSTEWNLLAGIERYLKLRLEIAQVDGMVAAYAGPKRVKNSGKAAGPKKHKRTKSEVKRKGKPKKHTRRVASPARRAPTADPEPDDEN